MAIWGAVAGAAVSTLGGAAIGGLSGDGEGGGGTTPVPPPSAAERRLQSEQARLLRLQRRILDAQRGAAGQLRQASLKQSGYRYRPVTKKERREHAKEVDRWEDERKRLKRRRALNYRNPGNQAAYDRKLRRLGSRPRLERKIEETPQFKAERRQRGKIEGLILDRQMRALQGRLPIDAGLLRDLKKQETGTRERLFQQLGPDYETSTPGIEVLGEFKRLRQGALDLARRGDISQMSALAQYGQPRFEPTPLGSSLALDAPFAEAYGGLAGRFGSAVQGYQSGRGLLGGQQLPQTGSPWGRAVGGGLSGLLQWGAASPNVFAQSNFGRMVYG